MVTQALRSTPVGADAMAGSRAPVPTAGRATPATHARRPWSVTTRAPALRTLAAASGVRRVRIVAWRDLDDPEAGGSELHAHRIATLWAAAGIDVELRTSAVPGAPAHVARAGYRATRRGGRYAVFAGAGLEGLLRGAGRGDALVEIWNGMPFWSPLWFRGPRVAFLHHVHAEMWRMALPPWLARVGEVTERRLAPPLYRSTRVVTLSGSARDEIVARLGLDPRRVTVAPPGVDPRFAPGPARAAVPLVVAVGRLVPVKRFDLLLRALTVVKAAVPELRAEIVGEGYDRPRLETLTRELGASHWVSMPGHLPDDAVLERYRRAWLVASASQREGWGMTLTEAGACGTPAVASDIAGHRDAVVHGRTGLLASGIEDLAAAMTRLVAEPALRAEMGASARAHASRFTWEAAARTALEALAGEVHRVPRTYRLAAP